jgi:uncharacterized protein YecE (DUF72 family)
VAQIGGYTTQQKLYIGCAGWGLASDARTVTTEDGGQVESYAARFGAVEITSSFHRTHGVSDYERWAKAVPPAFRFSVKVPKAITHEKGLADSTELMDKFLGEVAGLGKHLGALLFQLPPTLEFNAEVARPFFVWLRLNYNGDVFLEPRHRSWFSLPVGRMLYDLRLGRVAADPPPVPAAAEPGGAAGRVYFRLRGSPDLYASSYTSSYLGGLAFRLRMHARAGDTVWCMFDNTSRGAAPDNALCVARKVELGEKAVAAGHWSPRSVPSAS